MGTNVGAAPGNGGGSNLNVSASVVSQRERLGTLEDGTAVYDKKIGTHSHVRDHPEVKEFLAEALGKIRLSDFTGENYSGVIEMGRVIGMNACVQTSDSDQVVYAQREGRDGPTRFVLGRESEPCTSLKVVLWHNAREGIVVITTAFIGKDSAPEPWSTGAAQSDQQYLDAVKFWKHHALVAGKDFESANPIEADVGYWERRALPPRSGGK